MLTDKEILDLRNEESYKSILDSRFTNLAQDIFTSASKDFKPEISWGVKVVKSFVRERIIRNEFSFTTRQFLEYLLNREQNWPRTPESVKNLCESRNDFFWMRFDEERVSALMKKAISLMNDAEFRSLIKEKSSIQSDKDQRLQELILQIDALLEETLDSIQFKGVFDSYIDISKSKYYKIHGQNMRDEFKRRLEQGNLGFLPPKKDDDEI